MTVIIQNTDNIGTGIHIATSATNDEIYVLAGITVASTDSHAILAVNANATITIFGTIIADRSAIRLETSSDGSRVFIGAQGSLSGGDYGIDMGAGGGATNVFVVNEGTISGAIGIGMFAEGQIVNNFGTISGGIFQNGGFGITDVGILMGFTSIGSIQRLNNDGTITGLAGAVTASGDNIQIVNNSGLLQGDVSLASGNDRFVNTGEVSGNVAMGNGNDVFDSRLGKVSGEVSAGAGDDTVLGSAFDDTISGDSGADTLRGQDGDDTLNGGDDNDELFGRDGDDILMGGSGNDNLFGNDGDDVMTGGDGIDILNGGRGDDNMNGDNDNDRLFGRDGVDNLNGGSGDDFIDGGEGNDRLVGGGGNDRLVGGDGIDTAVFTGAQADYTIQVLSNGSIRVTDNRGGSPNGIDTISSVEFLNFTDAIVDVAGL